MRIGLYGMPTAGKSFIMDRVYFLEVISGSKLLRQIDSDFDQCNETEKNKCRIELAQRLSCKADFLMDGHYAFGDKIAFTEDDGKLYDVIMYLYIDPEILRKRMECSDKNKKYLVYDIKKWQHEEIVGLRNYCHTNGKDFYIIDNPPYNYFGDDISDILDFIKDVFYGYSCVNYARACANQILKESSGDVIQLYDGDKTISEEDTSNKVFGYKTHLYDGNFYSGFQAWKQGKEFEHYSVPTISYMPVTLNKKITSTINKDSFILTSGNNNIWNFISSKLNIKCFCGNEMSAETKYFITDFLQKSGKKVAAYGDGMNDYYMLKKADIGYVVRKSDGNISRSLIGKDLGGLIIV